MAKKVTPENISSEDGRIKVESAAVPAIFIFLFLLFWKGTEIAKNQLNKELESGSPSADVVLPTNTLFPVIWNLADGATRLDEEGIKEILQLLMATDPDCFSSAIELSHGVTTNGGEVTSSGKIILDPDELSPLEDRAQVIAEQLFLACKPPEPSYFTEPRLVTVTEDGTQVYWIGNHGTSPILENRGTGENSGQTSTRVITESEGDWAIAFKAILTIEMSSNDVEQQRLQKLVVAYGLTDLLNIFKRPDRIAALTHAQATSNLDELLPQLAENPSLLLDLYPLEGSDTE